MLIFSTNLYSFDFRSNLVADAMQAWKSSSSAHHTLFTDFKRNHKNWSFEYSLRSRYSAKTYTGLSHSSLTSELSTLFRIWIQAASNVWALTDGARKIQTLFPSGPFRIQIPKDRCREHAKPTVQTFRNILYFFFFFFFAKLTSSF